ncbi:MAG: hypothetical protein IJD92_04485 [Bacilli bacterium]|nr:hypothetical protein [Bacilli bacterium]
MVYKFDDENKLREFDGEKFVLLKEKNVKSPTNIYKERIKERDRKRKEIKKTALTILLAGTITVGALIAAFWPKIERQYELNKANNFMDKQIGVYLDQANIPYQLEGKDIIFSESDTYAKLDSILKDKGFTEHQILYIVYKTCDVNEFHKMAQFYGYLNGQDFLDKHYLDGNNRSYGGDIIKVGYIDVLENYIQDEYVETVEQLKENLEKKGKSI